MSNTFGDRITLSVFGESHGAGIGMVLGGLPAGEPLDDAEIAAEMARRAPGQSRLSTPRQEPDMVEWLSGIFEGRTTGAPVCGLIRNTNTRSRDYTPELPRPGHADLAAYWKYHGFADYRGGGHFSGRLTAPLVLAGGIARQILRRRGVTVGAHIEQIGPVRDDRFDNPDAALLQALTGRPFPLLCPDRQAAMEEAVLAARADGDSVGGVVEVAAVGVPAGLGNPFFDSIESKLSHLLFSIPAVKGVEFGDGFSLCSRRGSETNDPIRVENGKIYTESNHNGGINGGITNGMPVVCRVAVKPTPSIAKVQRTVNLQTGENAELQVRGRHDPCIVPRAVPVAEAAMLLCLLDEIA